MTSDSRGKICSLTRDDSLLDLTFAPQCYTGAGSFLKRSFAILYRMDRALPPQS